MDRPEPSICLRAYSFGSDLQENHLNEPLRAYLHYVTRPCDVRHMTV